MIADSALRFINGYSMNAAVKYYLLGLQVTLFPCRHLEKKPAVVGGFKAAKSAADFEAGVLEALAAAADPELPDNIGMPTGDACGYDVLDVDLKYGPEKAAMTLQAMRTLRDAGLLAGCVARARTPSRGYHLVFPTAGGPSRRLGAYSLDLKAGGGYVLVSPSQVVLDAPVGPAGPGGGPEGTTARGADMFRTGRYEWLWSRPWEEGRPLDWAAVCAALKAPDRDGPESDLFERYSGDIERLAGWLSGVGKGSRNSALFWCACRAAEAGLEVSELRSVALQIGLGEAEIDRTIASAADSQRRYFNYMSGE